MAPVPNAEHTDMRTHRLWILWIGAPVRALCAIIYQIEFQWTDNHARYKLIITDHIKIEISHRKCLGFGPGSVSARAIWLLVFFLRDQQTCVLVIFRTTCLPLFFNFTHDSVLFPLMSVAAASSPGPRVIPMVLCLDGWTVWCVWSGSRFAFSLNYYYKMFARSIFHCNKFLIASPTESNNYSFWCF